MTTISHQSKTPASKYIKEADFYATEKKRNFLIRQTFYV